jgi:hypothetical protein
MLPNRTITRTGPGTPAGQLLRRYWQSKLLGIRLFEQLERRCPSWRGGFGKAGKL